MSTSARPAPSEIPVELAAHVVAIEACLDELDAAFAGTDPQAVEASSAALQRRLADALTAFGQAQRLSREAVPTDLVQRLTRAQARVRDQHAAASRTALSMGRVLNVLFPAQEDQATYGALAPTGAQRALNAYR